VFGWPERGADLAFYYPTHALVTASEILFFWVARMIVSGLEFMGRPPFRDVYIHGTVRDDTGRKMSKSLGNSIDPLEIIREFSADALRASLVMLTATGQDVYVSREKFEVGRNFATKIWNAARFLQRHTTGAPPPDFADPALDPAALSPDDQHLLARLDETIAAAGDALEKFRFNDYALAAYDFVWHQYCDWYLEYAKGVLYGEDGPRRRQVLALSHHAFSTALRLLQPLMPFLAEELWHAMGYGAGDETVQRARWPVPRGAEALARAGVSADLVAYVEAKHDFVRVVRTLRADYEIPPRDAVDFAVRPASAADAARLEADRASVCALARIGTLTIDPAFAPAEAMPGELSRLGAVYMSIRGIVDVAAEKRKLAAQRAKVDADLERVGRTLANAQFASKAPREVVAQQEELRASLGQKRARLQHLMDMLG
jgi:valyl-tRNA synthetase